MDPGAPDWRAAARFARMFRDTTAALVEADPVGLIRRRAPPDEYDVEAAQVVRLVLGGATSREDVLQIASDVFAHWFDGDRYHERLEGFADTCGGRTESSRRTRERGIARAVKGARRRDKPGR